MSVLIKGLELPKEYGNYYGRYTLCVSDDGVNLLGIDGKLYKVVEVPTPYGRLIDADALYRVMMTERNRIAETYGEKDEYARCLTKYAMSMVENAPTIIEAEGKDDG